MKYLLDSHAFLWWMTDDPALSITARDLIADQTSMIYVSAATTWELTIKQAIGKLKTPGNIEQAILVNQFQPLAISVRHAVQAGNLPRHHNDPFDRMLVAQAQIESLTLMTRDKRLKQYDVALLEI